MADDNPQKKELSRTEKRRMRILLNLSGFLFFIAAGFFAGYPDMAERLFGFDEEMRNIMAITLAVIGLIDFAIARFFFKKDRI